MFSFGNMKTLTVFTPTYNRAHTIGRTYESLCRQTCKDFEWLVVDDGSADDTESIVKKWIEDAVIPIRYIKKENGGLATGYITAFANIESELNVCIDSDDFMPDNAVELIVNTWNKRGKGRPDIAGVRGLDFYMGGGPIGGYYTDLSEMPYWELAKTHSGDTKLAIRTDLLKALPVMKIYPGEKNANPSYYFWQIPQKYIMLNENLCWVDYQPNGMAAGIFRQYKNSPNSFAQYRRMLLNHPAVPLKRKFLEAVHYVSSCIFARQWDMVSTSPRKVLTIAAFLPGCLLNAYVRYKAK